MVCVYIYIGFALNWVLPCKILSMECIEYFDLCQIPPSSCACVYVLACVCVCVCVCMCVGAC